MVPSGRLRSLPTTTYTPQDPRTARSRCGRTATDSMDSGAVSVALWLRSEALTRMSVTAPSPMQPSSSSKTETLCRTIKRMFPTSRAHLRAANSLYRTARTDLPPLSCSDCKKRTRKTTGSSSLRSSSEGSANATSRSPRPRKTDPDSPPFSRQPREILNAARVSG
jgi:hypothetical protein